MALFARVLSGFEMFMEASGRGTSFRFFATGVLILLHTSMSGKSVPTELSPGPSLAGRLFYFLNFKRLKVWLWWLALLAIVAAAIFVEIQTSLLQSWFFTSTNERLFYSLKDGPSREIIFPRAAAPFDERRGYSKLPLLQSRLQSQGYLVTQQARQSETMLDALGARHLAALLGNGRMPAWKSPAPTACRCFVTPRPIFSSLKSTTSRRSWSRRCCSWKTAISTIRQPRGRIRSSSGTAHSKRRRIISRAKLQLPVPVQGGSTLAVQLEKFRHSPHGRTDNPVEKLRQLIGASLKAYQEGPTPAPGANALSSII